MIKTATNRIMDRNGAPAYAWLLCLTYVCFLLNHMWDDNIKAVPLTVLTGLTVDVSVLLKFYFWQKVYYKKADSGFPSESKEGIGHIVGVSESVGHALTWKILTEDTKKVIYRSQVRPFNENDTNLHADMLDGEGDHTPFQFVRLRSKSRVERSKHNGTTIELESDGEQDDVSETEDSTSEASDSGTNSTPIFDPEDLVGRTFLLDKQEDGQRFRATIKQLLQDHESDLRDNPTRIKFLCDMGKGKAEKIIGYNKMLEFMSQDQEEEPEWAFKRILSHQGPLDRRNRDYNGSPFNLMILWETGEITSEPLH